MRKSIYIANDEQNIREVVKSFLESEGYRVTAFENGNKLLATFQEKSCDLVILDVMMPGSSGFTVCSELRRISTVPIIMLTARDSDIDYATGINLGSDDYFTKPFSAISLVMRVKAIFRRIELDKTGKENISPRILVYADIKIDLNNKTVMLDGTPLELSPNEYNLLSYLIENKDRAISRDELLNKIWGYNSEEETRASDDTVRRLRKKLSGSRTVIDTVWGFGFRLKVREAGEHH
ncbi:MAG: DNA-binding response regulator [Firmicutes bacterium HGW-Firmicutes-13]|nr:MAG: DNA-binding response regulator [Firmicutes bacterium HGW-Firmicutes-13]